jgi:hypothetical protein
MLAILTEGSRGVPHSLHGNVWVDPETDHDRFFLDAFQFVIVYTGGAERA